MDQILKRGSTVAPRENEIQAVIREYSNNSGLVDFDAFDRDFKEFIGKAAPIPASKNPVVNDIK
jgi:hypothetical protein